MIIPQWIGRRLSPYNHKMPLRGSNERSIFYILLTVTFIAYGLFLTHTGFYWDDWPFAWIANFLGPSGLIRAFYGVRPLVGLIFFVTTSLIPPVPIYWQIFALIIRLASGLLAWFMFQQVWPQNQQRAVVAALLFLVFPGYSQHWVALTHINQEWIPFLFYLISFCFTARALRNPKRHTQNTLYALLFLVMGIFPTEYFIGLEPLRLFIIWEVVSEQINDSHHRFLETLKRWVPYLLIWVVYLAWLAYYYMVGSYDSYDVAVAEEIPSILQIILVMGDAIWKAGIYSWVQVIGLTARTIAAPSTLLTLACIGLSCAFFLFRLPKFDKSENEAGRLVIPTLLAGAAGILLGRLPSFAAGLPLTLQSSNDRFMISMMLAGSLFMIGVVELLVRNIRLRVLAFSLLIALGMGQQVFNANIFRRDWEKQKEFFWQLAWRIPGMKPNTTLLTDVIPVDYESDISFTAPINWMYAPDHTGSNLPYGILYTEIRLGGATIPVLEKNNEINLGLRGAYFHGSTSQAIVIYMPKNGCLRVLDAARGDQITYSKQSDSLVDAIPLSDLSNILDRAETVKLPFLSEPGHTWCYYYANAELAYQREDWNQVVTLINEATSLNYYPEDPFEWLAYIEAQAFMGDIEAARELSNTILARDNSVRKGLCEAWKRVRAVGPARGEMEESTQQVLADLQCIP